MTNCLVFQAPFVVLDDECVIKSLLPDHLVVVAATTLTGLEGLEGMGIGEAGLSVVFDVSDEARVTIDDVVDGLDASVGEEDGVGSLSVFQVAGLLLAVVVAGVTVPHSPVEVVVGAGSGGHGHQGKDEYQL